ncbi:replication initiator [Micromonospora sp. WMMC273]|uniref:replication initiator n=1 Tax=Micromonospora sp. WMMC273 TaxID=3015157 RepID=UPI0022B60143|nr:replication initiator [Micromonospora sp. WMMC273]MCZ7472756.1 plasmid replication initiator protein [Micromonospora sp. WMMC273]MCZ7478772.1 plasmid replication initiator protein [Micromonospora sp. WMMC273]MCZ7478795.1 plasmid replication initiator protein [Micromonospora sp. WMMC273]
MASTLDLTPRASVARGVGSNADVPPVYSWTAAGAAFERATRPDYYGWLEHVRAAAGCTRPIRLAGQILTVEQATGRVLDSRHTDAMPDAAIYTACGNRRATVCPACAQTYQRDAFQLLRAGLVGGKGVPESVASHPAVFATFTAPSFGTVHARVVRRHTCRNRRRCDCRAEPCHARRDTGLCPHGRHAVCWARHETGDTTLGHPLCLDCYDHDHQVVWNIFSGELWHRTKQAAERWLAKLAQRRGVPRVEVVTASGKTRKVAPVRLSPGKVAELQARGAVHFHAIARLDGVDPTDPQAIVPPPAGFTVDDLIDALRHAARQIAFHTPPHPDRPDGWPIAWGNQVDLEPIATDGSGEVTDGMVAGYLAKYATKSTEATGHTSTRLTADTIGDYADPDGDHTARLIDACWRIGRPITTPAPLADRPREPRPRPGFVHRWECPDCGTHTRYPACPTCTAARQAALDTQPTKPATANPYTRLRRWAHMLGYGGHFLTKARRYSVTFRLLRDTRVAFRRHEHQDHNHPDASGPPAEQVDEDTTLIVGTLTFAGVGWHTSGDALLANTAAAMARERRTTGREELAHELATTSAGIAPAAA